tara:strand:- start:62 stop:307 length:246 start_codon:yes stop_codon:yes gene_type:complete
MINKKNCTYHPNQKYSKKTKQKKACAYQAKRRYSKAKLQQKKHKKGNRQKIALGVHILGCRLPRARSFSEGCGVKPQNMAA